MKRRLSLFLLLLGWGCVSSGPDPFLVDIQERTQKVEVLLQGEKKEREKLARRVSTLLEAARILQEKLDREREAASLREEAGKRDRAAWRTRLEQSLASLAEGTGKALQNLSLQVKTALAGLARVEKGLQDLERAGAQESRLAEERSREIQKLEDRISPLEKGLRSVERGIARAAAERSGILARLGDVAAALKNLPSKFPKPQTGNPFPGLEPRLSALETSVDRLRRIWEEDIRGVLSGLKESLVSWREETTALEGKLARLEAKVQAASLAREGAATRPSDVPAAVTKPSEPSSRPTFVKKSGRPGEALPLPSRPAVGPGETSLPGMSSMETDGNPWDPVTGLGARSWPWLVGIGAFLFLLLLWALRGNASPVEEEERGGKRDEPGGEIGLERPLSTSPTRRAPSSSRRLPPSTPSGAAEEEDLPPTRVLAELPSGKGGEDEETRIRRALGILETSPLCLADPPVQVEPDPETGKVRIFFWVPGFATPGEIEELASRVESL